MKLKAIILVLLITLSMGAEHNNRCHNLVSEELAEITSLEIGEVVSFFPFPVSLYLARS
jgi:hypothetical protein